MQSTPLDNIPEINISQPLKSTTQETSDKSKQPNALEMQLIPQKNLKENEEADSSISSSRSESILSENETSPSKSKGANYCVPENNCTNADSRMETDSNGKSDDELNEHRSFRSNGECDNLNLPEPAHGPAGRLASDTSDAVSRTSRESGYFSCSSANESPPLQVQASGVKIIVDPNDPVDSKEIESKAVNHIEPVPEESEDDTVRSAPEHLGQGSSCKQDFDNAANISNSNAKEHNELQKENHCSSENAEFQGKLSISKRHDRVSVKDINKKLGELDHLAPTASMAMDASFELTYVDRVILELIETERMYVRALEDILAGYILAIKTTPGLPISTGDAMKLFGNIKDIYAFNRKFLSYLENCESDPVQVGYHFVSQDASFSVYTEYCTHYPISVSILTRCMKNSVLAHFFKSQQESLRHTLPLGAYLLKPVQRILKYHLILQEMVKHCDKDLENLSIIKQALATMTFIAQHINDMKRKNEDAVHIQELQSLLTNWPGHDLTTYGKIVMEGDLKLQGAKNDRLVFLFDKMMLIAKRREDGFLVCKTHIMCSDLILLESVKENPLSFLISPFDNPSFHPNQHSTRTFKQFILTARYPEEKKLWTQNIKRQILKNHHAAIPLQAQQSIMNMDRVKLNGSASKIKRIPAKGFRNTLGPTTESSSKLRRRADSVVLRKSLPLRAGKKKQETESDVDGNGKSNPDHSTSTPAKSRFSIPWINKSSPKHEPAVLSPNRVTSLPPEKKERSPEKKKKDTVVEATKEEKEEKEEKRFVKKRDRGAIRRNERHKESVIYKRYKRRQSQPVISEIEQMMKGKDPPSSPVPEENEKKKANADLSIDDFDSFEDFLSATASNSRDSVSWDVQIVEAVFDRFKKEEEDQKKEQDKATLAGKDAEDPVIINVPTIEKLKDSSDTSDVEESQKTVSYDSNETLISESVDELTPTEDITIIDVDENLPKISTEASYEMIKDDREMVLTVSVTEPPHTEPEEWSKDYLEPSPVLDASDLENVIVHSAEESDENDDFVKDDASEVSIPVSPGSKIKRSQSTQSSCHERRKYFEKLKEIRDRRHSNVSLNSYDANTIIQTGKVRNMIAQHRDYVASHSRRPSSNSRYSDIEETSKHENSNRLGADLLAMHQGVQYRRQQSGVASESSHTDDISRTSHYHNMDMDAVHNNQFSTLTTGSLPLNFTSSSNSSSSSSINDSEDHHLNCTSPTPPKYKVLLQPRLFLWRSQFEDNRTNTRRNFAVPSTAEHKHSHKHHSHSKHPHHKSNAHHKSPVRHHHENPTPHDAKNDSSDEEDWEDFETKTKKFETLCRSSSSEKLREKHTLKRSSFRTWKDLAASSNNSAPKPTFKLIQSKWNEESASSIDASNTPTVRSNRFRFASTRSSTSETESISTTASASVSRSNSYRSSTTNKATTSHANAPLRNDNGRNDSLSSTSSCVTQPTTPTTPTTVSVRRSSSHRNREPVAFPFARTNSPVATSLSRHSSMTYRDQHSPAKGRIAELETSSSSLKRSSSCRSEPPTSSDTTDTVVVRRTSSRRRRRTHPLTSATSSVSTSSIVTAVALSNKSKASVSTKSVATTLDSSKITADKETTSSSVNPPTKLVRQSSTTSSIPPSETQPSSKDEKVSNSATEPHQCNSHPENKDNECCRKSVLKLAQRFDKIAESTGNSNLLTGRNRLSKGRKHHSDLSLPFANETSKMHIDFGIVKKQAQLKRHQSCVTAKSLQNRETPLLRRFSEAVFSESSHLSTPAAMSAPLKPTTSLKLNSSNSASIEEKPSANLAHNNKTDKSVELNRSSSNPEILSSSFRDEKEINESAPETRDPVMLIVTQESGSASLAINTEDTPVTGTVNPAPASNDLPRHKETESFDTPIPHPPPIKNSSLETPAVRAPGVEADSTSTISSTRNRTRTNRKVKSTVLSSDVPVTNHDLLNQPVNAPEFQSANNPSNLSSAPKSRTRVRAHRNRKSNELFSSDETSTNSSLLSKPTPPSVPKNSAVNSSMPERTSIVTTRIRGRNRRKADSSASEEKMKNSSAAKNESANNKETKPLEVDNHIQKQKNEVEVPSKTKTDSCLHSSCPNSKSRSQFSVSGSDCKHSSSFVESLSKSCSEILTEDLQDETVENIKPTLSRSKPPSDFVTLFCKI